MILTQIIGYTNVVLLQWRLPFENKNESTTRHSNPTQQYQAPLIVYVEVELFLGGKLELAAAHTLMQQYVAYYTV